MRIELPDSVMQSIRAISHDATMSSDFRLAGVLILVFGWALYVQQESIDGRDFELPSRQWLEVADHLNHGVPGDVIDNINLGLSFMNQGPSSYTEAS